MKTISYAITVCNELDEIQKLIPFILEHKREEDEIVVLWDARNGSTEVWDWLYPYRNEDFRLYSDKFEDHFGGWKNKLFAWSKKDYLFFIDADEIPHVNLIRIFPLILESNNADLIWVPRVNTVEGISQEDILRWKWQVNEKGWINWPDNQGRIVKNSENIRWSGNVHEHIVGFKTYALLPFEEEWALYHPKTIEKQRKQNSLYDNL